MKNLRDRLLIIAALITMACGGVTTDTDGGADATSDTLSVPDNIVTTGCGEGMTQTFPIEAGACKPQLATVTSCNGSVCSWTATVPCMSTSDGGDAGVNCVDICKAIKPATAPQGGDVCNLFAQDGGTMISCGGCGI